MELCEVRYEMRVGWKLSALRHKASQLLIRLADTTDCGRDHRNLATANWKVQLCISRQRSISSADSASTLPAGPSCSPAWRYRHLL